MAKVRWRINNNREKPRWRGRGTKGPAMTAACPTLSRLPSRRKNPLNRVRKQDQRKDNNNNSGHPFKMFKMRACRPVCWRARSSGKLLNTSQSNIWIKSWRERPLRKCRISRKQSLCTPGSYSAKLTRSLIFYDCQKPMRAIEEGRRLKSTFLPSTGNWPKACTGRNRPRLRNCWSRFIEWAPRTRWECPIVSLCSRWWQ